MKLLDFEIIGFPKILFPTLTWTYHVLTRSSCPTSCSANVQWKGVASVGCCLSEKIIFISWYVSVKKLVWKMVHNLNCYNGPFIIYDQGKYNVSISIDAIISQQVTHPLPDVLISSVSWSINGVCEWSLSTPKLS